MGILGWVAGGLALAVAVIFDGVVCVVERNKSEDDTIPAHAAKRPYTPIDIKV